MLIGVQQFSRRLLAGAIGALFLVTAPGAGSAGYALNFSDLTAEKMAWRVNLFSNTPIVHTAPTSGTPLVWVLQSPTGTSAPVAGGMRFNVVARRQWITQGLFTSVVGSVYTLSVRIGSILTGTAPINNLVSNIGPAATHEYFVDGVPVPATQAAQANTLVTVVSTFTASGVVVPGIGAGVLNTNDTIRLDMFDPQFQVGRPAVIFPRVFQALTDVSTEFMQAFPLHTLFQDYLGTTAVFALEQPIGLALDNRFGGARGPEVFNDANVQFNGDSSRISTGVYRLYFPSGASISSLYLPNVNVVGKFYELSFTVDSITGTNTGIAIDQNNGSISSVYTTGRKVFRYTATSTELEIRRIAEVDYQLSNFTIREVYGTHAVQTIVDNRPTLSGRYNWVVNSAFTGGGNTPLNWTQPSGTGTTAVTSKVVDGNMVYRHTAVNNRPYFSANFSIGQIAANASYRLSANIETIYSGSTEIQHVIGGVNFLAGTIVQYYLNGVAVPPTEPIVANSKIACVITLSATPTGPQFRLGAGIRGGVTIDFEFSRPQMVLGVNEFPYQRVGNYTGDYVTAGFAIGARFNGSTSHMQVPSVILASDKALLFASVYKASDAAKGTILEHGSTLANAATYSIDGPGPSPGTSGYRAGFNNFNVATKFGENLPAPRFSVICSGLNGAASSPDEITLQIDGTTHSRATQTGDAGASNGFSAAPDNIGRRNGNAEPFNGMVFRIGVRGNAWTAADMTLAGLWANEPIGLPMRTITFDGGVTFDNGVTWS